MNRGFDLMTKWTHKIWGVGLERIHMQVFIEALFYAIKFVFGWLFQENYTNLHAFLGVHMEIFWPKIKF